MLADWWQGREIVELGTYGSPDDIAAAMAELLGRPVRARAIPRDRWPAALEAMGLPAGHTEYYEEMVDGFNAGWIDFGTPGATRVDGTTPPAEVFRRL